MVWLKILSILVRWALSGYSICKGISWIRTGRLYYFLSGYCLFACGMAAFVFEIWWPLFVGFGYHFGARLMIGNPPPQPRAEKRASPAPDRGV